MPSGFLILPDGRCFSAYWKVHDLILRAIVDHLSDREKPQKLKNWILSQLPGPGDTEELGYGAWLRKSDQTSITRVIDLRRLTEINQQIFCTAAKAACLAARKEERESNRMADLADMIIRYQRGEPALSKSDWRSVLSPEKGMIDLDG